MYMGNNQGGGHSESSIRNSLSRKKSSKDEFPFVLLVALQKRGKQELQIDAEHLISHWCGIADL